MPFQIEKVKWSWADAVQSKNVYRDDEFVRTKTKDEALLAIDWLINQPKGLTYTITVFRDDEYYTYYRHSMPCYGGLVKYRDSHGERYFMNPYFPRDIRVAFPEGDIVYIGINRPDTKGMFNIPYFRFILSDESPWISAFGSQDAIIFKSNYFILTDMNTDPTVLYSLIRLAHFTVNYGTSYKDWDPKADILASKTAYADPRRLAAQKPIRISGGTWKEGFGYTRPYNESIFKTCLPTKYEDFGKLAGYPNAPYDNKYFISEMKSVFGVDLSKGFLPSDRKIEEALVKAWDYFKEKASELSDRADAGNGVKKSIYGK